MAGSAYDVIVIGGGFCGVTAARECSKAGLRTLVLEARDRLGGRTHTTVWNGAVTELGGTWVHWTQPYVWAEIERYGLALAESPPPRELRPRGAATATSRPSTSAQHAAGILGAIRQYMGASRRMFPRPYRPFDTRHGRGARSRDRRRARSRASPTRSSATSSTRSSRPRSATARPRPRGSRWCAGTRSPGTTTSTHVEALGALSLPRRHEGADRRDRRGREGGGPARRRPSPPSARTARARR